jgi:hypothetical protein
MGAEVIESVYVKITWVIEEESEAIVGALNEGI